MLCAYFFAVYYILKNFNVPGTKSYGNLTHFSTYKKETGNELTLSAFQEHAVTFDYGNPDPIPPSDGVV